MASELAWLPSDAIAGRLLGSGGFATVYELECARGRFALKLLNAARADSGSGSKSQNARLFVAEAKVHGAMSHSGIIRTDGLVLVPPGVPGLPLRTPTLGLLMELADHGNLRDRIYKAMGHGHRAYSDAQAADWLLSLAEALAFLHGSNPTVIHRDVKAENVLLQSEAAAGPAGGAGAAAGVGGGGGGRLVAKLADLGLHVRLEQNCTVMLRRRASAFSPLTTGGASSPMAPAEDAAAWSSGAASSGGGGLGLGPGGVFVAISGGGAAMPKATAVAASLAATAAVAVAGAEGGAATTACPAATAVAAGAARCGSSPTPGACSCSAGTGTAACTCTCSPRGSGPVGIAAGFDTDTVDADSNINPKHHNHNSISCSFGPGLQTVGGSGLGVNGGAGAPAELAAEVAARSATVAAAAGVAATTTTAGPAAAAAVPLLTGAASGGRGPLDYVCEGQLQQLFANRCGSAGRAAACASSGGCSTCRGCYKTCMPQPQQAQQAPTRNPLRAGSLPRPPGAAAAMAVALEGELGRCSLSEAGLPYRRPPEEEEEAEARWQGRQGQHRRPRRSGSASAGGLGGGSSAAADAAGEAAAATAADAGASVASAPAARRPVGAGATDAGILPEPQEACGGTLAALEQAAEQAEPAGAAQDWGCGGGVDDVEHGYVSDGASDFKFGPGHMRRLGSITELLLTPAATAEEEGGNGSSAAVSAAAAGALRGASSSTGGGSCGASSVAGGKLPEHEAFEWVYGLTGQAGSCFYMAPEVYLCQPYNEKCDVFSFGVLAYELWSRQLLLYTYMRTAKGVVAGIRKPNDFAAKVSEGFRPPRGRRMTDAQWELVCRCWHQDPCERPPMAEVAAALRESKAAADSEAAVRAQLAQQQKEQQQQLLRQLTPLARSRQGSGRCCPSKPGSLRRQASAEATPRAPEAAAREGKQPGCGCVIC
ncbi:hypothetical protein CHLRE_08g378950v5 [Chlamydomonas reinhardtii]|uniref:Protein kinase domain-containing protein n=1 Tax=Chlamydomonas reinhardtii TaxID=3055 RepID=A0A2K3DHW6_CHLRE|nr:uncharacterized protein CHLRE_08g378950v5 [Chlamydomonas reinhardtii]PNW80124.1 hypothetical protein CHLRE_08g378950v5 [Chlamydomonas reinhardtii]